MHKLLKELAHISRTIGKSSAYVQGGGGNTSVKLNNTEMAIKASGTLLADLTTDTGYAIVDFPSIVSLLDEGISNEAFSSETNKRLILKHHPNQAIRPSIETGFHSLLGKFVIHSHSVFVNVLGCSKEGKAITQQLFPESLWIDYEMPGLHLTLTIQKALLKKPCNILFLQNHGIIVSGENSSDILKLHNDISDKISKHLDLPDWNNATAMPADIEHIKNHVLFPDQVVFTQSKDLLNTQAGKETLRAYQYIHDAIATLGFTHHYLNSGNTTAIKNMESEKYRQGIAK